eukprot:725348-Amphidinium_carterae.1
MWIERRWHTLARKALNRTGSGCAFLRTALETLQRLKDGRETALTQCTLGVVLRGREQSVARNRLEVAMPLNPGTGQTLQTGLGRAPWATLCACAMKAASSSNHLGPRDDLLLSTMQRMWSRGMSPQTIAEVRPCQDKLCLVPRQRQETPTI